VKTTTVPENDAPAKDCSVIKHPLVKAGLIPNDHVNVLVAPPPPSSSKGKKEPENAKVLTSADV
jgi:hypothetical protein